MGHSSPTTPSDMHRFHVSPLLQRRRRAADNHGASVRDGKQRQLWQRLEKEVLLHGSDPSASNSESIEMVNLEGG
jgi:hypothetical protein